MSVVSLDCCTCGDSFSPAAARILSSEYSCRSRASSSDLGLPSNDPARAYRRGNLWFPVMPISKDHGPGSCFSMPQTWLTKLQQDLQTDQVTLAATGANAIRSSQHDSSRGEQCRQPFMAAVLMAAQLHYSLQQDQHDRRYMVLLHLSRQQTTDITANSPT